jgi:hypothetical protein
MNPDRTPLDPRGLAKKLRDAAAELRRRHAPEVSLALRLERRAEAMLSPDLPRWWADDVANSHAA